MNYDFLFQTLDANYLSPKLMKDDFEEIKKRIKDDTYFDFIKHINGGFFFQGSLNVYSISNESEFSSLFRVNEAIKREYLGIVTDEFFFAQEAFGNQFGFSSNGIIFFNIETGQKEKIANSFDEWASVINGDLQYFTGNAIVNSWNRVNKKLEYNERLCAKRPFAIGGEYDLMNLYAQVFPKYIESNANIARQIYNLPEGTPITLKIDN